ncbi:unnamed protein product [Schistosoma intercalatum]|nr:unnamed protein product [Schistosoma intercalatum]
MPDVQVKTNEPQYENWLGAHSKKDKYLTESPLLDVELPHGLQLSVRRGPEVELYDVAGVHLLCPPDTRSNNQNSKHVWSGLHWFKSFFNSKHKKISSDSPVILSNKSADIKSSLYNLSSSHLPTNASQCISSNYNQKTQTRNDLSLSTQHAICQKQSYFSTVKDKLSNDWLCLNKTNNYCSSPNVYKYYENYFILKYRQVESNLFISLNLIVCIFLVVSTIIYSNYNTLPPTVDSSFIQHSYAVSSLHLTHINLIRLALLISSTVLLLISVLFANMPCISKSSHSIQHIMSNKSSGKAIKPLYTKNNSIDTDNRTYSYNSDTQESVNLIVARKLRRNLHWSHGLSYIACIFFILANLPWSKLYHTLSKVHTTPSVVQQFNCSSSHLAYSNDTSISFIMNQITIVHQNNLFDFENTNHLIDNLWLLIFSIILILGFFDVDSMWSKYWRYGLTIIMSILYFVLVNLNYGLTHSETLIKKSNLINNTDTGNNYIIFVNSSLCPQWIQKATLIQPVLWWTDHRGILWRSNLATLCAILCAHLIGQLIAVWTSRHRYRLFLTASYIQAIIFRLHMTESKLHRLSKCLVPAPLADDLVNDFINGHLSWSSPLVIYLRNVTFLSAELVGLSNLSSNLASTLKSNTNINHELICQQFISFINDIYTCFDYLAQNESCYRIRLNANEYLCIAGYPETRVDHARSCIDLGLNMLKIIGEISERSHVQLELRVSVHTGTAYAIVLGRSRLGFDLIGDDVTYVSRLKYAAYRPCRVLTSRSTFNQLPEGFRGEAGPIFGYPNPVIIPTNESIKSNHHNQTTMETYFVQPRTESTTIVDTLNPIDLNGLQSSLSSSTADWSALTNLDLNSASAVITRLASVASILCRHIMNKNNSLLDGNDNSNSNTRIHDSRNNTLPELPLGFLFHSTLDHHHHRYQQERQSLHHKHHHDEDEESKAIKVNLLRILSNKEFDLLDYSDYKHYEPIVTATTTTNMTTTNDRYNSHPLEFSSYHRHHHQRHGDGHPPLNGEPFSTSELLAMIAVNLAESLNRDHSNYGVEDDNDIADCSNKFLPCQKRAGKLRKNCPSIVMDPPTNTDVNGGDLNLAVGITNSMGTSFATTTATTAPLHPYSSVEANDPVVDDTYNKNSDYHELSLLHNLKPMINKSSLLNTTPLNENQPCWLTLKQSKHHQSSLSSSSSNHSFSSTPLTTVKNYNLIMDCFKRNLHKVSYTSLFLHNTNINTTISNHVTNSMMNDTNNTEDNKLYDPNNMDNNEERRFCRGNNNDNNLTGLLNLFCFNCTKQRYQLENGKSVNDKFNVNDLMKNQSSFVDVLYFSTIIYIPFLILFGFIHLLVMPRSLLLFVASSIATAYITLQLAILGACKRFPKLNLLCCTSPTIWALLLWLTVIVVTVTTSLNMFLCSSVNEVNYINEPYSYRDFVNIPYEQYQFHSFNNNLSITSLLINYNFKGNIFSQSPSSLSSSSSSSSSSLLYNMFTNSPVNTITNTSSISSRSNSNNFNRGYGYHSFFDDHFIIIGCLSILISTIFTSAALYRINTKKVILTNLHHSEHMIMNEMNMKYMIITPQLTRFLIGLMIFILHIIIILWTVNYNGLFYILQWNYEKHASNHLFQGTSIQQNLFIPNFVQSLFAQFSFLLLAILLPRSLEYQCRLMHQWKVKSQSTLEKLSLTSSALARLLVSIVPRFVIAKISSPERAIEIYSKSHQNIGLVLINFIVIPSKPLVTQQQKQSADSFHNSTASTTINNSGSKSKTQINNEEPTEIADRVRLLNRVIHLVDSLALGQQQQTTVGENTMNERESNNSNTLNKNPKDDEKLFSSLLSSSSSSSTPSQAVSSKLNLVKVYTGGTMVGYAAGLGTLEDSDCQNHHSLKASQTTTVNQWSCLIKFIERVIVICDQINQKTKSSSSSSSSGRQIYVQAALHSGSCIFGFVSSQHPVFTLWGEPLETCRQLLSKHQLNHLGSQHFILATDKLISLIPSNLLDPSSVANLHLNTNQKTTIENSNLLNQYLFTWCTIDPSNGKIISSAQLQRSAPLAKMLDGRPPFIDRLLHFCTVRSNATINTTTAPANETTTNTSISSNLPYIESTSESNKQVCSLFNTYDQPASVLSNNPVTNGLILSQTSGGDVSSQKQNHACDPIKSNQYSIDHHSRHNTSHLPTTNDSNDRNALRTTTSILPNQIALNSVNPVPFNSIHETIPKVLIPTTTTIGVQQRLANVVEQTDHRRKSQLSAGANVLVNTPTSQFCNPISSPPPPPPHQRSYPTNINNNNISAELSAHLNTPISCTITQSPVLQSTTVTGTANMQHVNNDERKHNPAPHILKNSQQKCGIPSSNITHKTCEINQGNHKLQPFSPQLEHLTKKNQIHSTTITTTNNSNNNNLNAPNPLLKPVRPSSYWPVPDESLLSSDQIQTNHQNNNSCNNKEKSTRPISAGITKTFDGIILNILNKPLPEQSLLSSSSKNIDGGGQHQHHRPISLSSTDSFLAAERACAYATDGDEDATTNTTYNNNNNNNNDTYNTTMSNNDKNSQNITCPMSNICNSQSIYDWDHVQNAINQLSSIQNNDHNNHDKNINPNKNFYTFNGIDDDDDDDDEDDVRKHSKTNENSTSHHNPLYTDNEYESMAESQSNLSDVVNNSAIIKKANRNSRLGLFATSSQVDPRDRFVHQTPITQQQSLGTNQTIRNLNGDMDISKKLIKDSRLFSVIDPSSTNIIHNFVETNGQPINTNGIHFHSASHPMQKNVLDFPDYQRPTSPGGGYSHEKQQSMYPTEIEKSDHSVKQQLISIRNVSHHHSSSPVSGSSSTGHSLASGSRKSDQHHHSYCNNGMMIAKTNVNDSKHSSNSSRSNSQCLQSQSNRLTMIETTPRCIDHIIIPNISDTRRTQVNNQCLIDEPMERYDIPYIPHEHIKLNSSSCREPSECPDAEYVGTASLEPLSMAVLTSMTEDGLTSCDGEELTEDDDANDGLDSMTDSNVLLQHQDIIENLQHLNDHSSNWLLSSRGDHLVNGNNNNNRVIHNVSTDDVDTNYNVESLGHHVHHQMTDSLLANPDLDARDSELGEDFDYATPEQIESMHCHLNQNNSSSKSNRQMSMNYLIPSNNNQTCVKHNNSNLNKNNNNNVGSNMIRNNDNHMLLEAALLSTSTTPLSQFGAPVDNSSNETYSVNHNHDKQPINNSSSNIDFDDLTSEELFVYHGRIGQGINNTSVNTNNKEPSYLSNIHQSKTQFTQNDELNNNSHHSQWNNSSEPSNSTKNISRPSLPEIAPVSLPDFSSHSHPIQMALNRMPWYSSSPSGSRDHQVVSTRSFVLPSTVISSIITNKKQHQLIDRMDLSSDYDNLYPNSFQSSNNKYYPEYNLQVSNRFNNNKHSSTLQRSTTTEITATSSNNNGTAAVVGRPALRKLAKVNRSRTNWPLITPGEESDTMSGYIGDAASSVYDTDDDDDDDDDDEGDNDDDDDGGRKKKNTKKITSLKVGIPLEVETNRNNKDSSIINTPVSMDQNFRLTSTTNITRQCQQPVNNNYANLFQIDDRNCLHSVNNNEHASSSTHYSTTDVGSPSYSSNVINSHASVATENFHHNNNNMLSVVHRKNSTINKIDPMNNKSNNNESITDKNQVNLSENQSNTTTDSNNHDQLNCTIIMEQDFNQHQQSAVANLHRTISIADSHTSGGRSEYDNVDKSGFQTENNSLLRTSNDYHDQLELTNYTFNYNVTTNEHLISSSSPPISNLSTTVIEKMNSSLSYIQSMKSLSHKINDTNNDNSRQNNNNNTKSSRIPLSFTQQKPLPNHSLFDAQIAAEARQISRQLRVMGWIPVDGEQFTTNANTSENSDGDHINCEANLLPTSGLHRTHLFLLPGSSQINRACSRQPSLRTCRLRCTGTGAFGSGIGSETVTTVTSQLDEDDDDERAFDMNNGEYDIDLFHENDINNNINNESEFSTKSGFHGDEYIVNGEVPWQYDVEKWTYQNFSHSQLGCLLVRPRSLSATCLNIISSSINNSSFDAPHNDNGDDEEVKVQNKRWKFDNANDDEHELGCNSMKISKTSYRRHRYHRHHHQHHSDQQQYDHHEHDFHVSDNDNQSIYQNDQIKQFYNDVHKQKMPNSIQNYQYLMKFSIDNRKWASDPELQLTSTCQIIDHIHY